MSPYLTLLVPLMVGIVVGVPAWLLLRAESDVDSTVQAKTCGNCGSSVLAGWRLCPDCGRFIECEDADDVSPSTDACVPGSDSELTF